VILSLIAAFEIPLNGFGKVVVIPAVLVPQVCDYLVGKTRRAGVDIVRFGDFAAPVAR